LRRCGRGVCSLASPFRVAGEPRRLPMKRTPPSWAFVRELGSYSQVQRICTKDKLMDAFNPHKLAEQGHCIIPVAKVVEPISDGDRNLAQFRILSDYCKALEQITRSVFTMAQLPLRRFFPPPPEDEKTTEPFDDDPTSRDNRRPDES